MNLKLREYREKAGLTQEQLGNVLDKSFSTIKAWEAGKSFPNAKMIWKMCEFFDTDPNTFMGWYDAHPREDASLSKVESALISDFRKCTPERKRKAADAVRDQRSLSQEQEAAGESYDEVAV